MMLMIGIMMLTISIATLTIRIMMLIAGIMVLIRHYDATNRQHATCKHCNIQHPTSKHATCSMQASYNMHAAQSLDYCWGLPQGGLNGACACLDIAGATNRLALGLGGDVVGGRLVG